MFLRVVSAGLALLGASSLGSAQVQWDFSVTESLAVGGYTPRILFPSGGETSVSALTQGFTMTGDAWALFDFTGPEPEITTSVTQLVASRRLTVGPAPVAASLSGAANFKVVFDSFGSLECRIDYGIVLSRDDNGAAFDGGIIESNTSMTIDDPATPGILIVDHEFSDTESTLLMPGRSYLLTAYIRLLVLEPADPPKVFLPPDSVAVFEFGGLTSFEGLTAGLEWIAVPSPSTHVLLGLGGVACLRRRR